MIIDTKFDRGDLVYWLEDNGEISDGIIAGITIEIAPYTTPMFTYEMKDGYQMVNPNLFSSKEDLKDALRGIL